MSIYAQAILLLKALAIMKKIILFFLTVLLFFLPNSIVAQISGKVFYTTILESQDFKELEGVLIFEGDKSLFSFAVDTSGKSDGSQSISFNDPANIDFEFKIGEPLTSYHKIFIDREEKVIISSERYFKDGAEHPCLTVEPTDIFDWRITNESKVIGSFTSTKATTTFRGRNYIAWFTTEVPKDIGPWKFHGLPGLILEVYDEERGVQFLLSSFKIPFEVKKEIVPPSKGERISIKEYATYQDNFAEEIIELIMAKLPRGIEVSDISTRQVNKGIEREYEF